MISLKRIVMLVTAAMLLLAGCSEKKSSGVISGSNITPMPPKKVEETEAPVVMAGSDSKITAVLLSINAAEGSFSVRELNEGIEHTLNYTGATDVRNAYDEVIILPQIKAGEIVDVEYDAKSLRAYSVLISDEAFKSSNITNFKADYTTETITIGSGKYRYDENLVVISQGGITDVSQVIKKDEVTVWGIDNKIYSVSVDKGHGYVRFTGNNHFIGGTVEIGRSFLYRVSENMMITVPEGEYKITMTNNGLTGSKTISVARDMEAVVDFSEFKPETIKTGSVKFDIAPSGASLYINNKKTDYREAVELDYGRYAIRVEANGYDTYSSTLVVESLYENKVISLSGETEAATQNTSATVTATEAATATENPAGPEPSTERVTEGKGDGNLIIESPVGAEVYIDAVYYGQTPLTIKKEPGEHIITFHKNGYATKSYAIDVSYEDADQKLSFPEMNEE